MADLESRMVLPQDSGSDEEGGDDFGAGARGQASPGTFSRSLWRVAGLGVCSVVVMGYASVSRHVGRRQAPPAAAPGGPGFAAEVLGLSSVSPKEYQSALTTGLLPKENIGDNNSCSDDEEIHMGLCYDKCSILTNDEYPFRQSAWTCCKSSYCSKNLLEMFTCCKHNMGWCSGFDIAGMLEGQKICPHSPGACLADEELFLGMCYKSCALLTDNKFPYRVAPASCCMRKDASCIIEKGAKDGFKGESLTNSSFNVGGGCNDGQALTKCDPHPPQKELTR